MAKSKEIPELREILKEQDRRVLTFCHLMVEDSELVDSIMVGCFEEFGRFFRSTVVKYPKEYPPTELRIRLFQYAWEQMLGQIADRPYETVPGRDTREMIGVGEDLLEQKGDLAELKDKIFERLRNIDTDYRAPVVLKDILGFGDEQVARILGIRWGVYRHRLNRGRLDLTALLRGRLTSSLPALDSDRANEGALRE